MHSGRFARIQRWIQRWEFNRVARFWRERHASQCHEYAFWLAIDRIVHWMNCKVSGHPQIWPLSWFLLSHHLPVQHALSIGCGPGNLEREVIRHGAAAHVTGVDISPSSLEVAERLAREAGYADRITYRLSDAGYLACATGSRTPL